MASFSVSSSTQQQQQKNKYAGLDKKTGQQQSQEFEEVNWKQKLADKLDAPINDIERLIEQKKEEHKGLVTLDSSAAILIGKDKGIDLLEDLNVDRSLDVENVVPEMSNVDIEVRVDRVFSQNTFDGGRVRSIEVSDPSGSTQVTVWDDDCDALDHLETGDIIMVDGGYTKHEVSDWQQDNYDGIPAIQIGDEGEIVKRNGGNEVLIEAD